MLTCRPEGALTSVCRCSLAVDGCCAGINTAIYSPSGANSGVGFAVPVDLIRSSVNQIIQFGKVLRPILGISFAPDQSVEQVRGIMQHCRADGSCEPVILESKLPVGLRPCVGVTAASAGAERPSAAL